MRLSAIAILFAAFAVAFTSCKKCIEPLVSLIDVKPFAPNSTCAAGGIKVSAGVDKNRNNILDQDEITSTTPVCNGSNGGNERVIAITFFSGGTIQSSDTTLPRLPSGAIVKFSKANYTGVDSIKLLANVYVQNSSHPGTLELFNITDDVPIANGRVTSNYQSIQPPHVYFESANVYNSLPDKEITLGVRIWAHTNNSRVAVSSAFLMIYRH